MYRFMQLYCFPSYTIVVLPSNETQKRFKSNIVSAYLRLKSVYFSFLYQSGWPESCLNFMPITKWRLYRMAFALWASTQCLGAVAMQECQLKVIFQNNILLFYNIKNNIKIPDNEQVFLACFCQRHYLLVFFTDNRTDLGPSDSFYKQIKRAKKNKTKY